MPVDRPAILRNAEKLLRQGKLDQAIAEYLRLVEDQPNDWNTANVLGDLYVRAGQIDKAVEQFIRIADHLHDEGFLPKAVAVYKKILKLKPDHEHAMLQAAEIAGSQGLAHDARSLFNAISERRRTRGDARGVAQIVIRLATLDPADFDARLAGVRARQTLNDLPGAISDLKDLAAYLHEQERPAEALQALNEAAALAPDDEEVRGRLMEIYAAAGDFARARTFASTAEQLTALAGLLDAAGRSAEARATLSQAKQAPQPGRAAPPEAHPAAPRPAEPSADAGALLSAAETELREGRPERGLALLRRALEAEPGRRQDVAQIGCAVADTDRAVGFEIVQFAAADAIAAGDHPAAAAVMQEFVARAPGFIPALTRLVEVCVDGALEATLYSSQAQLADAYLAAGAGGEARFIAEDLLSRQPWDQANVERLRQALQLVGEKHPDQVIAARLAGRGANAPGAATSDGRAPGSTAAAVAPAPAPAAPAPVTAPAPLELEEIFDQIRAVPSGRPRPGLEEVDLNPVLDGIKRPAPVAAGEPAPSAPPAGPVLSADEADEAYRRGASLHEAGRPEEAIGPLEAAAREPRLRFAAASLLGRIHRERGALAQATEWLERAAQSPAPTRDQGHLLLFDLADALERAGETSRALAVCMELQADAGNYRDVAARIDRLATVRARG